MKEYVIEVNGIAHIVQLSDEDAKARGLVQTKEDAAPKNKARTTDKKG